MSTSPLPPNVLLICTDHHRYDYLPTAGHPSLHTPHLDALAQRGITFTQCVTNCPVCIPARCALASGLEPHRFGGLGLDTALSLRFPTFYQQLRDYGYWTAFSGKIHLAGPLGVNPGGLPQPGREGRYPRNYAWGFCDPWETCFEMNPVPQATHPWTVDLEKKGLWQQYRQDRQLRLDGRRAGDLYRHHADSCFPLSEHSDAFVVDHVLDWFRSRPQGYRFFHQVNLIKPHDPFDPSPQYAARYRNAPMPPTVLNLEGKPPYVAQRTHQSMPARTVGRLMPDDPVGDAPDDPQARLFAQRQFTAMIAEIDELVGRLVQGLKDNGLYDDTVVIYTSDHGEMLGDFGCWSKMTPYEPSARIPLIMAGPGIPQGLTTDALVEWIDLNPTICQLAGVPLLDRIDGRSLMPLLRGQTTTHRQDQLIIHSQFRCLRTERYKFIDNLIERHELYDLANDPREQVNIFDTADPTLREALNHRLYQRILDRGYVW